MQAQRRRAMASGTVPVILPGGGCALPGLQDPLTGSHPVGPCKRSAAGRWHQVRYPWCCRVAAGAWPGLQEPLTGSHPVGPCKPQRRRARFQARYPWCCRVAAGALSGLRCVRPVV